MTPTESLLYVCQSSQTALSDLTGQLRDTPNGDQAIPALLRAIQREADVLSASLAKLAAISIAELPEPKQVPPSGGIDLLDHARRVFTFIQHGGDVCDKCGGIHETDEDVLVSFALSDK